MVWAVLADTLEATPMAHRGFGPRGATRCVVGVGQCGQRTWETPPGSPWRDPVGGQEPQRGGSWHPALPPVLAGDIC